MRGAAGRRGGEAGAGSVLAVAVVAAIVCATAVALPAGLALAQRRALAGAADAAALAAADVRVGLVAGEPCPVAVEVARANSAEISACRLDGLVVTVTVVATSSGLPIQVSATAGPPPDAGASGGR